MKNNYVHPSQAEYEKVMHLLNKAKIKEENPLFLDWFISEEARTIMFANTSGLRITETRKAKGNIETRIFWQ